MRLQKSHNFTYQGLKLSNETMPSLGNDNELNIAELSGFLQDSEILDNMFEFDSIDIDDLLDKEQDEGFCVSSDDKLGRMKSPSVDKIPSMEVIDISHTKNSSLTRVDSLDNLFLNSISNKSKCDQHVTKPALCQTLQDPKKRIPISKPKKFKHISTSHNELLELTDDMILFQSNLNHALESLFKTMKRTEETRILLQINSKTYENTCHNAVAPKIHGQHSLGVSSLPLSNHVQDSMQNNVCFRNQHVSSAINGNKKSNLPLKRCRKKTLCKFIGYRNRGSS